ncbi:hypothetical protein ACWD64_37600 [Streptomyces antibioticus]
MGREVIDDQVLKIAEVPYLDPRDVQAHTSPYRPSVMIRTPVSIPECPVYRPVFARLGQSPSARRAPVRLRLMGDSCPAFDWHMREPPLVSLDLAVTEAVRAEALRSASPHQKPLLYRSS